jgi:hypothetical protein
MRYARIGLALLLLIGADTCPTLHQATMPLDESVWRYGGPPVYGHRQTGPLRITDWHIPETPVNT